jgi:FkbM family methyltransferase
MNIKNSVRLLLNYLHLDLTKNLEYDRYTKLIMKIVLHENSNSVDVGCHKGEILEAIIRLSPYGKHYGFEPIPELYEILANRFSGKAVIFPFALSDKSGVSTFQYVHNAPAYSGIKKRKYDISTPDIEVISIELRILDELIPEGETINFVKIDVEGGEFGVLQGARNILKRDKPYVIFEFGLGASDYYGTKPDDIYNLFTQEAGMRISLLKGFVKNRPPLKPGEFEACYNSKSEYYFIAHR